MDFFKKNFKKVQNLDVRIRKLIFWTIIILLGIGLFFVWVRLVAIRISQMQNVFPRVEMPKIEIPQIEIPTIIFPTQLIEPTIPIQ